MKVFEYNPETGTRGELLGVAPLATYTDRYMPNPPTKPAGFGKDARVSVHVDAGRAKASYKHPDKWVCFCLGNWRNGSEAGTWEWVILPPHNLK